MMGWRCQFSTRANREHCISITTALRKNQRTCFDSGANRANRNIGDAHAALQSMSSMRGDQICARRSRAIFRAAQKLRWNAGF
jgi:hypothetical protein